MSDPLSSYGLTNLQSQSTHNFIKTHNLMRLYIICHNSRVMNKSNRTVCKNDPDPPATFTSTTLDFGTERHAGGLAILSPGEIAVG